MEDSSMGPQRAEPVSICRNHRKLWFKIRENVLTITAVYQWKVVSLLNMYNHGLENPKQGFHREI